MAERAVFQAASGKATTPQGVVWGAAQPVEGL
jgi:hypothetical protein